MTRLGRNVIKSGVQGVTGLFISPALDTFQYNDSIQYLIFDYESIL